MDYILSSPLFLIRQTEFFDYGSTLQDAANPYPLCFDPLASSVSYSSQAQYMKSKYRFFEIL